MSKLKKRTSLIIILVLSMILTAACSQETVSNGSDTVEERTFKMGHIRPEGSQGDIDVNFFKEEIAKASDNKINIEIYPASQLGDYPVVQERVSIGDIEMQIAPLATNIDKSFGIANAPYLVENWEQAKKLYSSDGKLIKSMEELLDEYDIKLLGTYPLYFGGIALIDEPDSPGDANVPKEIKIRVPAMKSFEQTALSLGYIATPLPWADTFTSMQTGIVDGAIGGGAEGYYSNFKDLIKYYLPLNDHFEMWFTYMNKTVWESLSPSEQKIIQDAALALEEKRFNEAEADEQKYHQLLEEEGIKVIEFSDTELRNFAIKAREEVWPVIKGDFDEELFEELTKDIK